MLLTAINITILILSIIGSVVFPVMFAITARQHVEVLDRPNVNSDLAFESFKLVVRSGFLSIISLMVFLAIVLLAAANK